MSDHGKLIVNEHLVPEHGVTFTDYLARGQRVAATHLIRYEWAMAVLARSQPIGRLLDVACGSGYGSHGIAQRFPATEVVGVDYDPDAVAFARGQHHAPNLSFSIGDVTRWEETLGDNRFDCVVSFDTIEHVGHREVMMQNVVEHLHPDGVLMLSTPVRPQNVLNPGWAHHKIEFSAWALHDFLRRYFQEVLAPDLGTLPCVTVFDEINRDEIVYLLKMNPVVCRGPIRMVRPLISADMASAKREQRDLARQVDERSSEPASARREQRVLAELASAKRAQRDLARQIEERDHLVESLQEETRVARSAARAIESSRSWRVANAINKASALVRRREAGHSAHLAQLTQLGRSGRQDTGK